MPLTVDYRGLLAGERRGWWPSLLRGVLRVASLGYSAAVRWRNRRFDRGVGVRRVDVPVISVGNITTGGTGKTPLVAWLARWLRDRGLQVTLISRGYKAADGSRNDEALELAQQLPDVPHFQNAHRIVAAEQAIREFHPHCLLLDDAFQHRRLHRDLDIVLIDALEPFGYGHLLPRGLLREPLAGLARADIVVLSRADAVSQAARDEIRATVRQHAPFATWIEVAHQPRSLFAFSGPIAPLSSLQNKPLAAFCGIGNPAGFRHTLESCGYQLAAWREFPDHHRYSAADLRDLADWLRTRPGLAAVVCTHKDLVKLRVDQIGDLPLWAVGIGMEILSGAADLERRVAEVVA